MPIKGRVGNGNIFEMMGQLSPYFANPSGFGVDEYSLPDGAEIIQLHMLHRHGERYPTTGAGAQLLAEKIQAYQNGTLGNIKFTGELSFLNDWKYLLGNEILTPVGKQQYVHSSPTYLSED